MPTNTYILNDLISCQYTCVCMPVSRVYIRAHVVRRIPFFVHAQSCVEVIVTRQKGTGRSWRHVLWRRMVCELHTLSPHPLFPSTHILFPSTHPVPTHTHPIPTHTSPIPTPTHPIPTHTSPIPFHTPCSLPHTLFSSTHTLFSSTHTLFSSTHPVTLPSSSSSSSSSSRLHHHPKALLRT